MTSCFVYKVIRDLESIDHLCINPIHIYPTHQYHVAYFGWFIYLVNNMVNNRFIEHTKIIWLMLFIVAHWCDAEPILHITKQHNHEQKKNAYNNIQ